MKTCRILNVDLQASYDQISSEFAMRPTPQFLATELRQGLSPTLDFEAAFAALRDKTYTGETAKAAIMDAQSDLLAELNRLAGTFEVDYAPAVYYRPSGPTHITESYLTKGVAGETKKPWDFALELGGGVVKGYVTLMMLVREEVSATPASESDGQSRKIPSSLLGGLHAPHQAGIGSAS